MLSFVLTYSPSGLISKLMARMSAVMMLVAVCVIIVSHYTRISRSSTGVLLQTCYRCKAFFTLHWQFSLQSRALPRMVTKCYLQSSALKCIEMLYHFSFRFGFRLFNAVENSAVEVPAVLLRDLPRSASPRSLAFQQDEQICTKSKICVRKLSKSLIIRIICK